MDLPVRLGWLPGEAVALPGQFPAASDGGSELIIGPVLQGTCTGLRVRCSARTAEVLAAAAGGTATYECTLKGTAAAAEKDLFTLEYKPQGGLRAGSTITFKLLSRTDKSTIRIEAVELLEEPTQDQHNTLNEAIAFPSHQNSAASNSSSSQMDGIRDLISQLTIEPTDEDGVTATSDPKRAFMAAIAKSALNTGKNQIENSRSGKAIGGGGGGFSSSLHSDVVRNKESADAALALLPQIFTLLQQQQQEIRELKTSFSEIEALCRDTRNLIVTHYSSSRKEETSA